LRIVYELRCLAYKRCNVSTFLSCRENRRWKGRLYNPDGKDGKGRDVNIEWKDKKEPWKAG
jgi:hypothetical protein